MRQIFTAHCQPPPYSHTLLHKSLDLKILRCSIKDQKYADNEQELKHFLEKEHNLMANRLKSKDRVFDPYTKDIRLVDEK